MFHVVLAQGQLELDGLDRKIDTARREYEERRLEVSTLASPQRIIEQAEALGLVMPDGPPTYLVVPGAPAPAAERGGTATTLDDWKKVKRHLGDGRGPRRGEGRRRSRRFVSASPSCSPSCSSRSSGSVLVS